MSLATILLLIPDVVQGVSLVIAGASLLSALTPTPKDDAFFARAKTFINILALNVMGARGKK